MKKMRNIGLLLLFISLFSSFFTFFDTWQIYSKNEELIHVYFESSKINASTNSNQKQEETYIGVLEIPEIHLKRGFYEYNSKNNTIQKTIQLITSSCTPDRSCNFLLAAHSGTSHLSFFKNLDSLSIGSVAILHYKQEDYSYQLTEILHEPKNGTISLEGPDSPTLVLTTCSRMAQNVQDIYIFKQTKK